VKVASRLIVAFLLIAALLSVWVTITGAFTEWRNTTFIQRLLFLRPTLVNFQRLFGKMAAQNYVSMYFPRWMANSTIIATSTAVLQTLVSTMAGYALARNRFPGRGLLLSVLVARVIVPATVLFVPTFVVVYKLGMVGMVGMILPNIVAAGTVLLTRQFASGLASEVLDAARMDGASEFQILRYVGLPMLTPIMAMTFSGAFGAAWTNLLWANIMLRGVPSWTVVQGMLYSMSVARTDYGSIDYGFLSAGSFLSILIPAAIFIVLHGHIEEGMKGLIEE